MDKSADEVREELIDQKVDALVEGRYGDADVIEAVIERERRRDLELE